MNKMIFALIGAFIILLGVGGYYFVQQKPDQEFTMTETSPTTTPLVPSQQSHAVPETVQTTPVVDSSKTTLGMSAGGHAIMAYHFGKGSKEVLFVGGMHGGYEWNTSLVAYALIDQLNADPKMVPQGVKVTVIPVLNPDGLNTVVGTTSRFASTDVSSSQDTQIKGRYNANGVDLNRNFDCDWQAEGVWQKTKVSGGSGAFSEPESQAIRKYIESQSIAAVVIWYSAAGGVYASNCHLGVLSETDALTTAYAQASKYPAHESFDFYATTGDMANWLAKKNIPAISVLLTTHQDVEWEKNKAGINAVLQYIAR